jgi:hypothetical protein
MLPLHIGGSLHPRCGKSTQAGCDQARVAEQRREIDFSAHHIGLSNCLFFTRLRIQNIAGLWAGWRLYSPEI